MPQQNTTLLQEIQGVIREISTSVARVEERQINDRKDIQDIKKVLIIGNGHPAIVDTVNKLDDDYKCRQKESQEIKEKKEKISARTWAVILIFITQFAGLIVLFIRTGSIH